MLLKSLLINRQSQIQCRVRIELKKVASAMEIAPFSEQRNKAWEHSLILLYFSL